MACKLLDLGFSCLECRVFGLGPRAGDVLHRAAETARLKSHEKEGHKLGQRSGGFRI